jgi:ribonucleoside-diphosphate reductase alpha chain
MAYTKQQVEDATLAYFEGDKLATQVFISKYALQDENGDYLEASPTDLHWRMAKEFARIEQNYPNPLTEKEIYQLFKDFKYIVPQGSVMAGLGSGKPVSLSNCTILPPPKDSLSGILDTCKEAANLFKRRCGTGFDLSSLRPEGMAVNNSAKSSTGAWSFAELFSDVGKKIGQAGRRSATLELMDSLHPDIEKFVTCKIDTSKVTAANISVKLRDEFMSAVENNGEVTLRWPIDSKEPKYTKTVKAKELWKLICDTATNTAEPGIAFWDTITKNLPADCYDETVTVGCNPCAEIFGGAYDSCRLISHNLYSYVKRPFMPDAYFDYELFDKHCRIKLRLNDDLVDLELEHLESIMSLCDDDEKEMWKKFHHIGKSYRRAGCGTHGLADALAALQLRYDSEEALKTINKIYETQKISCYDESVELAKSRGSFAGFDWEKEKDNHFIKRLPEWLQEKIKIFGRRNIALLTNAPTGSVAILSQTSSGIEPTFRVKMVRRRKLDFDAKDKPDFIDANGDKWIEFEIFDHNVLRWLKATGNTKTNNLPEYFIESNQVNWEKRVEVQGIITSHLDQSVSSTINLPKGTKPEVVGEIYMRAWKKGLKGITVYVDGSRDGVLLTEKTQQISFNQQDAPKRPQYLECEIHNTTISGEKWAVLVGLFEGKPFEVFAGKQEMIEIPKNTRKGKIKKIYGNTKSTRYDLVIGEGDNEWTIKDIINTFANPLDETLTRFISLSLRTGAKVQFVCEQLNKSSGFGTIAKTLHKVLKKYIPDESVSSLKCPECSGKMLYKDGCVICEQCGNTKCG